MGEIPAQLVLGALLVGAVVVLWALGRLSQRFPWLGLAIGLAFVGAAAALVALFERRYFQSEGSAAGLVLFGAYLLVTGTLAAAGLTYLGLALSRLARDRDGRRSYAKPVVVCGAVVLAIALVWPVVAIVASGPSTSIGQARDRGDDRPWRTVPVKEPYRLEWRRGPNAAGLELVVQPADLPHPGESHELRIEETQDGPMLLDVVLPSSDATQASLRLHRNDGYAPDAVADALAGKRRARREDATPEAFWVESRGGDWRLLGWDCAGAEPVAPIPCHAPGAPLARWMPMLYGLQRVALHTRFDASSSRCHMSFRYEGRIATVASREPCASSASLAAFGAGLETLGRLSSDARRAPSPSTVKQRVQAAISRCDAVAAAYRALDYKQPMRQMHLLERLDEACEYAMRLAAPGLATDPAGASRAIVHASEVKAVHNGSRRIDYSQEVLAALDRAGQGRSADAVRAHALRAYWLQRQGRTQESHASLYALLPLAPGVLRPDDPSYELIGGVANALPDAEKHRYVALLAARHAQAQAAGAGGRAEVGIRYELCSRRLSWNLERETLKECADALLGAWTAPQPLPAPLDRPPEAAAMLGYMYQSYAYATRDFAGGEAGVAQVLRQAEARVPADPANAVVFTRLRDALADLGAKAAAARR